MSKVESGADQMRRIRREREEEQRVRQMDAADIAQEVIRLQDERDALAAERDALRAALEAFVACRIIAADGQPGGWSIAASDSDPRMTLVRAEAMARAALARSTAP